MLVKQAFEWQLSQDVGFLDSRPIALELGLDVPLIAHNGALTKHARTLETVAVLPLPLAAARGTLYE